MLTKNQLSTISATLSSYVNGLENENVSKILNPIIADVDREAKQSDEQRVEDAERVLRAEYYSHVRGIALEVFQYIKDGTLEDRDALDRWIHETIDGNQWTFITHKAIKVLLWSNNDGTHIEEFGSDGLVSDGCINWSALAFSAMQADLLEDVELFNQEDDSVFSWIDEDEEREEGEEYDEDENVGRVEKARAAIAEFKRCGYDTGDESATEAA